MQSEGQQLRKMREAELKRRDKAQLRELAERIRNHRHTRAGRLKEIRGLCRIGRQNLRARIKAIRSDTIERLRDTIAKLREAERDQCHTGQRNARAELTGRIDAARAELDQERRAYKERYGRKSRGPGVARARARERASESTDEVIQNLPPELVPVFRKVAGTIKGGPRRSRTEAFLEWAEENPDEVHGILYRQADRDVERLIQEHEQTHKRLRKGARAYRDPEAEAAALAGVPF